MFTFLENALSLGIFTHAAVIQPKWPAEFFKNLFPLTAERGGEIFDLLYQIQSQNMKMTSDIRLFIFCMICNFSKCDGFTVL